MDGQELKIETRIPGSPERAWVNEMACLHWNPRRVCCSQARETGGTLQLGGSSVHRTL